MADPAVQLEQPIKPLWWLGPISSVLAFAGIWALMEGISRVVLGFEVCDLPDDL